MIYLKSFKLTHCSYVKQAIENLVSNLPSDLDHLTLSHCSIENHSPILSYMRAARNLTSLDYSGNPIDNYLAFIDILKSNTRLTEVYLDSDGLSQVVRK